MTLLLEMLVIITLVKIIMWCGDMLLPSVNELIYVLDLE